MLTKPEIYAYNMRALREKALHAMLLAGVAKHGDEESLASTIGWPIVRVKSILRAIPLPDLEGTVVVSLSLDSLRDANYVKTKARLERAIIAAFSHFEPEMLDREMARFFQISARQIARLKAPVR